MYSRAKSTDRARAGESRRGRQARSEEDGYRQPDSDGVARRQPAHRHQQPAAGWRAGHLEGARAEAHTQRAKREQRDGREDTQTRTQRERDGQDRQTGRQTQTKRHSDRNTYSERERETERSKHSRRETERACDRCQRLPHRQATQRETATESATDGRRGAESGEGESADGVDPPDVRLGGQRPLRY